MSRIPVGKGMLNKSNKLVFELATVGILQIIGLESLKKVIQVGKSATMQDTKNKVCF